MIYDKIQTSVNQEAISFVSLPKHECEDDKLIDLPKKKQKKT